jgi:hypothetical protein
MIRVGSRVDLFQAEDGGVLRTITQVLISLKTLSVP